MSNDGPRFVVHVPGPEQPAAMAPPPGDGCHCGTCTCNPNMTPAVRFDLSPAQMEGAIRDHLIALGWTPPNTAPPPSAPPSAPAGVEEMQRRLDREESDHGRTIDQRDAAEEALGRMFQAVTGRVAEWSSAWGYTDAIEEVEEHVAALARQPAAVDGLAARLVDELDGLVGESYGVSGLHLNGDVAPWDELLPGGRFERLSSLDELRAALAAGGVQAEPNAEARGASERR